MSKQIFLVGCGGHGRVVLEALLLSGIKVKGIIDSGLKVRDKIFGTSVLGDDRFLDKVISSKTMLVNGVGANPNIDKREKLFKNFKARGFSFNKVQHPSAVVGLETIIGEGSQIMAGALLQNRVRVGENVVINTHAGIDHDCIIESHSFISPGVVLCGDVLVGNSTFIGAGATLLPSIKIGANVIIGAGSVVTKNLPDGWIVAGNPAIKIGINK